MDAFLRKRRGAREKEERNEQIGEGTDGETQPQRTGHSYGSPSLLPPYEEGSPLLRLASAASRNSRLLQVIMSLSLFPFFFLPSFFPFLLCSTPGQAS